MKIMELISFNCSKSYYYFLVFWALDLFYSIVDYLNIKQYDKFYLFIKENNYLNLISLNISDLLGGFLVLITHIRSKSAKENSEVNKDKIPSNRYDLIYNDLSIKNYKGLLIFIVSTIDLIGHSSKFIYYLIFPGEDYKIQLNYPPWLISVDILSRILFLKIILKVDLYKHHIFSFILLIIGFLPITISGIINIAKENHAWYLLFIIPKNILFPLGDTLSKIVFTDKFVLPQQLMFYKGVINFIMHLIAFPILLLTKALSFKNEDGTNYFSNVNFTVILLFILNIISKFFQQICIYEIIYIFTPQHVCFVSAVSWMIIFIQNFIIDKDSIHFLIINIFAFLIVIFGTLLFNEMIIINAYNLNKDTKIKILEREKNDILTFEDSMALRDVNDISKDENGLN